MLNKPFLTVDDILNAYASGIFPMADARESNDTYWVEPKMRGIIPLETFKAPRSLKKFIGTCNYTVTINKNFSEVLKACAETPRVHESSTWINKDIEFSFLQLHQKEYAHSIEVWDGDELIGGLYGLAQGGCFNGESMFSKRENASKIALVHLVERLKYKKFTLLDTQFINDHLKQFGCIEIPQADYLKRLDKAIKLHVIF